MKKEEFDALFSIMKKEWQAERAETQMTLGALLKRRPLDCRVRRLATIRSDHA